MRREGGGGWVVADLKKGNGSALRMDWMIRCDRRYGRGPEAEDGRLEGNSRAEERGTERAEEEEATRQIFLLDHDEERGCPQRAARDRSYVDLFGGSSASITPSFPPPFLIFSASLTTTCFDLTFLVMRRRTMLMMGRPLLETFGEEIHVRSFVCFSPL
jgi:hypothetical protein